MHELREYQRQARYQLNTLVNARRHPVFVSPTGTGKTRTAVAIIADRIALGRRVFVLTPQAEIFDQWMKDLSNAELNPGYINSEGVRGRKRMVYVCMPLSLVNNLALLPPEIHPHEIITDECHHSAAQSWEVIYSFFDDATRIGLTATPRRTDGKGLDHLYTDIVQTIQPRQAIDQGYLAKPMVIVPEVYHMDIRIRGDDYDPIQQAKALGEPRIIGDVLTKYRQIFGGHPVLVACSTFEHAKMMTEQFREAGWQWDHIHSDLHYTERRRMLKHIKNGRLHGLCTVGIGIEGMDIPGLYGLIWLRRTLSLTIYLQFIGRVLRPLPGKENGVIVDPVGNLFIHGFPDAYRKWALVGRLDAARGDEDLDTLKLSICICPHCGVMNAGDNTLCHFCGADLSANPGEGRWARKIPAMVEGRMVVVDSVGAAAEIDVRANASILELAERKEEEDRAALQLEDIDTKSKGDIIRRDLFGISSRRKLFDETVERWL